MKVMEKEKLFRQAFNAARVSHDQPLIVGKVYNILSADDITRTARNNGVTKIVNQIRIDGLVDNEDAPRAGATVYSAATRVWFPFKSMYSEWKHMVVDRAGVIKTLSLEAHPEMGFMIDSYKRVLADADTFSKVAEVIVQKDTVPTVVEMYVEPVIVESVTVKPDTTRRERLRKIRDKAKRK